jgi:hypothetical protein
MVLVVGLFLGTLSYSPPANGDGTGTPVSDNTDGDEPDGGEPNDEGMIPQEFLHSANEEIALSVDIDVTFTPSAAPGGFRPGIPVGGGGGGGNGNDDDDAEEPSAVLDAIVRVTPNPVPSPGLDVQAFAITNASSATHATFELFGPDCPISEGDSCAEVSDSSELSPPSFNDGSFEIHALCTGNSCEEYNIIFSGEHLDVLGEYRIRATFLDDDNNIVAIEGMNFRVQSFFVVPESQIGAIALIISSLGTLAVVYYAKTRKR